MLQFVSNKCKERLEPSGGGVDANNKHNVFFCAKPIRKSGWIWLIPLAFSAVWIAVLAGILVTIVFPELGYDIPTKIVAGCAVLFWLALVLLVRSNIKRINSVIQIRCDGNILSVVLSDNTRHRYLMNDIAIHTRRAKNIGDTKPVKNNHFRMSINSGRKTIRYDVHVDNEERFFSYLSHVQRRIRS